MSRPCEIGELVSQTNGDMLETARITAVATEEDFLNVHPEWADPAFDGLRFEHYYWIDIQ